MTQVPISIARQTLPKLVTQVNKFCQRFVITVESQPKAVLMSFEELESLEETAGVLAIPGAVQSIQRGIKQLESGDFMPVEMLEVS